MGSLDAAKGIYIGGLVMMGVAIELTAGIYIIEGTRIFKFIQPYFSQSVCATTNTS